MLKFRPATGEDMFDVNRMLKKLADVEGVSDMFETNQQQLEHILFSENSPFHVIMCEKEGKTAGLVTWTTRFSTFAAKNVMYVLDCYVEEECRGQDIGTALFMELKRIAKEKGYAKMEWPVNRNRPKVHDFYARMGAKEDMTFTMWEMDVK